MFRRLLSVLVLLGTSVCLPVSNGQAAKTDIEKIQATYIVIASEENGKKSRKEELPSEVVVSGKPISQKTAERLMSGIRPAMSLREVKRVLHQEAFVAPDCHIVEHGGVWCDIPISPDYLLQVRLNHAKKGRSLDESRINYSPRLRDRKTLNFISGAERSW